MPGPQSKKRSSRWSRASFCICQRKTLPSLLSCAACSSALLIRNSSTFVSPIRESNGCSNTYNFVNFAPIDLKFWHNILEILCIHLKKIFKKLKICFNTSPPNMIDFFLIFVVSAGIEILNESNFSLEMCV